MFDELMETLNLPKEELKKFADDVLERFNNPFVDHQVTSIMLNSFPKYATRDLPGVKEYLKRKGVLPEGLVLGLAAIIVYYKGGKRADGVEIVPNDAPEIMAMLTSLWNDGSVENLVKTVLADTSIWGEDLNTIPGTGRPCNLLYQQNPERRNASDSKRPCRLILLPVFFNL